MKRGPRVPSDYRGVIKQLRKQGYEVVVGGSNHNHLINAEGQYISSIPSTPGDRRGVRNWVSQLRSRGIEVRL